jgi:putative transposase
MPNTPPRLEVFEDYDPPMYFVTFNTRRRVPLLANEAVHDAFISFAKEGAPRGVSVGRYVLMPDHIHLFVRMEVDRLLSQWVRLLKRKLSAAIGRAPPHWQEGFFDHLIRHSESYAQKWAYVCDNPQRAGLVNNPTDWKWQGEIISLEPQ